MENEAERQHAAWAAHMPDEVNRYLARLECPAEKDPRAFNATTQRARGDLRHALAGFVTRFNELPARPAEPAK